MVRRDIIIGPWLLDHGVSGATIIGETIHHGHIIAMYSRIILEWLKGELPYLICVGFFDKSTLWIANSTPRASYPAMSVARASVKPSCRA